MQLELTTSEQQHRLQINELTDGYQVVLDGRPVPLEVLTAGEGEFQIRLSGRLVTAYVAARDHERQVFIDGRFYSFRIPDEDVDSVEEAGTEGPNLVAQMPGTLVKVLVQEGQTVSQGDGLLIVESMKMETEIAAPFAGIVKTIHVRPAQTVDMGEPLIDLEPAPQGD